MRLQRQQFLFLSVFASALIVRLIFIWQWQSLPFALSPYLDALSYDRWARQISEGHWLRATAFYQSPLYPYFLALIYKCFGSSAFTVGLIQAMLSAWTCALLSLYSARAFNLLAGAITGLLAVFYRPLIFYSAPLMKESLALFCLSLFLYYWQQARNDQASKRNEILAGIALGLVALARTNVLLLAPVIFAERLWRQRKFSWLFTLAVTTTILPATLHNRAVSGDWILVNYAGGFNFYIGHAPEATGANNYPSDVSTDPTQEESDTARIAADGLNHTPSPSEISMFWSDRAWNSIAQNPMQELALMWNKTRLFFNAAETPDNYDLNFISREFKTILNWPLVGFMAILVLAAAAAAWTSYESLFLVILSMTYFFSVAIFYVTDRYRLPIVVFLLPLAGAGAATVFRFLRTHEWRRLAFALSRASLALAFSWQPLLNAHALDSYNWGLVADLYSSSGGHDHEAVAAIQKAMTLTPANLTAQALIHGAESFERLGDLTNAESLFKRATTLYPEDGLTYHNLGRFYFDHARYTEARDLFLRALQVSPWNYQPYVGLALVAIKLEHPAEAAWAIQQGERIAPDSYDWARLRRGR